MNSKLRLALLSLMIASVLITGAPEVLGIKIVGALIANNVAPGESFSNEIGISLDSDANPADYAVEVKGLGESLHGDFKMLDENQDNEYSARPFITVSPTSFHLVPNTTQKIKVEGIVPNDIGSGGRYALISIGPDLQKVKAENDKTSSGGEIGVSMGANIPVIITIEGTDPIKTGEITEIKLNTPISAKQQNVSLIFKNTGNYHYKALAKAEIKDPNNGNSFASASTEPTFTSIIPPFSRTFNLTIIPPDSLKPGTYELNSTVSLADGTILATKETSFEINP